MKIYTQYRNYILVSIIILTIIGNYFVAKNTWFERSVLLLGLSSKNIISDFTFKSVSDIPFPSIPSKLSDDAFDHPIFVSLTPIQPIHFPYPDNTTIEDESLFQFDKVGVVQSLEGSLVTVVWEASEQTLFQEVAIYKSDTVGEIGILVGKVDINSKTWRDENIDNAINIYYSLRPIRLDGSELQVLHQYPVHIVDTIIPDPPTFVDTFLVSDSEVNLLWTNSISTDLAFSRVYRGTVPGGGLSLISDNVSGNTYSDITVESGVDYIYIVTSVDFAGNESDNTLPSELNQAQGIASLNEPYPITDITTSEAFEDGGLFISWDAPTTSTDFGNVRIYRSEVLGELGELIVNAGASDTFIVDSTASTGIQYYYTIKAVNTSGVETGLLKQFPGRARDSIPPFPPTTLDITFSNPITPTLTWLPPEGEVSFYRVYRSRILGERGYIISSNLTSTDFTDSIPPSIDFYYTVTAIDRAGNESDGETYFGKAIPFAESIEEEFEDELEIAPPIN